ncbi:5'/3'-nucleotidase SurE [Psychrobacter sp. PP-21]|uniref:5'/3'-nucleotidase SurE n=1 Tax=Psychrobacter sp. PP-21 TaxID=2957503 RepID=UPI0029A3C273|nr:5'/3'-nucleotidase SurE [Psychrobacter sp. PP-21]MDX2372607.1 5'/3'-nucleotidase SurE [Psychrobacter sp. PP-21]
MKFLISNDDGVHAPGLLALFQALSTIGEVVVVAPNDEQSGYASALSVSKPLHTHQLPSGFVAVNGTPADCIHLALHELHRDMEFNCVITGINSGANLGQDVMFSGTFGAALTAQLFGIPAIATSLVGGGVKNGGQESADDYKVAANEIVKLLTDTPILDTLKSLPYHVLNVNIPDVGSADDIRGRKITSLAHKQIAQPVRHMIDPRGRDAYWLSLRKRKNDECMEESPLDTAAPLSRPKDGGFGSDGKCGDIATPVMTDDQAVVAGYVSLSPVRLHHTPTVALAQFSTLFRH